MKILALSLALAGVLTLSACHSENKENSEKTNKQAETMEQQSSAINATPQELDGIKQTLDAYVEAAIKGDSKIAKPSFAETATISYSENDSLVSNPIQALFEYYDQTGPHHAEYTITSARVAGSVAVVSIDSKFSDVAFDDMFTLVKDGNDWKIVSKVYHVK